MKLQPWMSAAVLAATVSLAACGARPLTGELQLLETNTSGPVALAIAETDPELTEDQNIRELQEQAREMLRSAREYFDNAVEQNNKRKAEQTELLARIGLLYYGAAENFYRTAEARDRLNVANTEYEVQRERRNEAQDRLEGENQLITLLTTINALFEDNAELRRQLASRDQEAETVSRALYSIQEARMAQREAEGVNARRYSAASFDTASASLARATALYEDDEFEQSTQVALEALEQFRRSIDEARPAFAGDQERLLSSNETAAQIFDRVQRSFGDTNAYVDSRGIVVVIPQLFEPGSSAVRAELAVRITEIAAILGEFSRQNITIEGHTGDEGSTADNLALSEQRATAVRDALVAADVRANRIETTAMGEESPRFSNENAEGRTNNDRVEIVFVFRR